LSMSLSLTLSLSLSLSLLFVCCNEAHGLRLLQQQRCGVFASVKSRAVNQLKMRRVNCNLLLFYAILSWQSLFVCCNEAHGLRLLQQQRCGVFASVKVTNGREVRLASRPWMALLRLRYAGEEGFHCAGTLITDRFVLTAAHCVAPFELVYVRLGEHNLSTDTDCKVTGKRTMCVPPVEDVGVAAVYKHEEYSSAAKHNDIALIKLERQVEFKKHIKPICLPIGVEASQSFVVTGWGITENGTAVDVPREAAIELQARQTCAHTFDRIVKQSQLCAGATASDSCRGDSGGPLSYPAVYATRQRFVQFGIVSYGARDCGNGYPADYTDVASYLPWITGIIGANSSKD
ncbi:serine protease grass-like, partial [Drosophila hydei]|uniref:Serine protease grass-like n=1 Tax=Drosophila hydei TaxID=7224 RepID=A0A6J2T0I2_DROHY